MRTLKVWMWVSLVSLGTVWANFGLACQTIMFPSSKAKVMGKNYVWSQSYGRVFLNRKDMNKKALVNETIERSAHVWRAKYASLTFNQFAENFPNGGMNSEGLAIEILLGPAGFPKTPSENKKAVSELQWIQLLLDSAATTKEAIEIASEVDVVPLSDYKVHYHVCDKTADCAIFEYQNGVLVISNGNGGDDIPFGCDNSGYARKSSVTGRKIEVDDGFVVPSDLSILPKVIRPSLMNPGMSRLIQGFEKNQAATSIEEVRLMWRALEHLSAAPQWQIVYELANGKIHFKTQNGGRQLRSIDFSEFSGRDELECGQAIYVDPKSGLGYMMPPRRFNLAQSSYLSELRKSDFKMGGETSTLLSEATPFLRGAGLDSKMLDRVFRYQGTHTACNLSVD